MMELFFEVLYALLGIYAIVDYRDIFFFVFPLCLWAMLMCVHSYLLLWK